jgi:DNA-binding NarL/FixJ family response regulator
MALRCLIVDDYDRFLEVATCCLDRDGITVVGTATTVATALEETGRLRPDIVLVDVTLGEESGFELARRLVDRFPHLRSGVVLISTRAEDEFSDLIASSPAVGFVSKTRLSVNAVREVLAAP